MKRVSRLALVMVAVSVGFLPLNNQVSAGDDSDGYTYCADEHDPISITETTEVRYGENGEYFYQTVSDDIVCDNDQFGDPIVGTFKHCYCRPVYGTIKITKWLCPEGMTISNDMRPDSEGETVVDFESLGCELGVGYGFGYDEDYTSSPSGPTYIPANFSSWGDTDEGGMLFVEEVPAGDYMVGEIIDGVWVAHEDVAGVLCSNSPINGKRDNNLEAIDITEDETTYCVVVNETCDIDEDGVGCDEEDNCPLVYNPGQRDVDEDGIGNKCDPEDNRPKARVVVRKIVCDDESYLPNWGNGGADITKNTAKDFVEENSEHCWFAEGRDFQWGYSDAGRAEDTVYGEADGWTTFGSTNENGKKAKDIVVPEDGKIRIREVLQEGYIPFSFVPNGNTNVDDYTAELYCHTDVKNYDNGDQIVGVKEGGKYFCVAFNVPKPGNLKFTKWECPWWVAEYELGEGRYPDADGNMEVDPAEYGCELAEGYTFARPDYYTDDDDDDYGDSVLELCTTDETGMCMSEDLDVGEYWVGELGEEGFVGEKTLLGFYCAYPEERRMERGQTILHDYFGWLIPAYIAPGQTTYCVAYNKLPATVKVTKYLCPEWVNLYDESFYPNHTGEVDVEALEEAGCVLGEGYDFGYEEMRYETKGEHKFFIEDEENNIEPFCTTDESGMCSAEIDVGEYRFGEVEDGNWAEDMLGMRCRPTSGGDMPLKGLADGDGDRDENPNYIHPNFGDRWVCIAYNPKPLDMCDGNWYGILNYGYGDIQFDFDNGYSDEWISIYSNGEGGYTFDFHGSTDGKFAYANGTLSLVNAELVSLDLVFDGGDTLENHNEDYDEVGGEAGDTNISFDLRVNGNGEWKDIFDFYLDDSQICNPDPYCGDEHIDEGEECDDGNNENGDGCDEYCQEEESTRKTGGGGQSSTPPALLQTGPEEEQTLDELIDGVDASTIPACNEDTYIIERLEKLLAQDQYLVHTIPADIKPELGLSVILGVANFIEGLQGLDVETRNEFIRILVCRIELLKEARGLRHAHIGYESGHDHVDYLFQYLQDLAILEFTVIEEETTE